MRVPFTKVVIKNTEIQLFLFNHRSYLNIITPYQKNKTKKIAASRNPFERVNLNNLTGVGRYHNNGIRKGLKDDGIQRDSLS
jgi:hypothetical protein